MREPPLDVGVVLGEIGEPDAHGADHAVGGVEPTVYGFQPPVHGLDPVVHGFQPPLHRVHPMVHRLQPHRHTAQYRPELLERGPDLGHGALQVGDPEVQTVVAGVARDDGPGGLLGVEEIGTHAPSHFAVAKKHGYVEDGSTGEYPEVRAPLWITFRGVIRCVG
ncbi:hypothetical protein [Streptomyces violascens]|uniref:hypothetical protein n=1 Tax=Streptomyces violascens TaxID=67381 RepID=UPI003678059F